MDLLVYDEIDVELTRLGAGLVKNTPTGKMLWRPDAKLESGILLTNRRAFTDSDDSYDTLLNHSLSQYLWHNPAAVVLDLAGGYDSSAAREIESTFPNAVVTSLDLLAVKSPGVRGDAAKLPIADSSIDLMVAVRFLDHCRSQHDFPEIVSEMVRALKPGGQLLVYPHRHELAGLELCTESQGTGMGKYVKPTGHVDWRQSFLTATTTS